MSILVEVAGLVTNNFLLKIFSTPPRAAALRLSIPRCSPAVKQNPAQGGAYFTVEVAGLNPRAGECSERFYKA